MDEPHWHCTLLLPGGKESYVVTWRAGHVGPMQSRPRPRPSWPLVTLRSRAPACGRGEPCHDATQVAETQMQSVLAAGDKCSPLAS